MMEKKFTEAGHFLLKDKLKKTIFFFIFFSLFRNESAI